MVFSLDETIKGAGPVQATNLWDLSLELNSGLGVSIPSDFMFRCKSVSGLPEQEVGAKEFTLSNFNLSQPGIIQRKGSLDIDFVEGQDAIGTKLLQDLSSALYAMTESNVTAESVGWENLKSTAYIWLLDHAHNRTRGFKLMHAYILPKWPTSGLEASDEVLTVGLQINYNWWSYLSV